MYDTTSTAHQVAHELVHHPHTIRLNPDVDYTEAELGYPASASISFDNGVEFTIFDGNGGIQVQTFIDEERDDFEFIPCTSLASLVDAMVSRTLLARALSR